MSNVCLCVHDRVNVVCTQKQKTDTSHKNPEKEQFLLQIGKRVKERKKERFAESQPPSCLQSHIMLSSVALKKSGHVLVIDPEYHTHTSKA